MTTQTKKRRPLTAADLYQQRRDAAAAEREVRAAHRDGRATADELAQARQRLADADEAIRRHERPHELDDEQPEPPTLDELRAERDRLEDAIAERRRANAAEARDRALAAWEATRSRVQAQLDDLLARRALALFHGGFDVTGLGDLAAALSPAADKRVRQVIENYGGSAAVADPADLASRLSAVKSEIAKREAEGQPTGAQARAMRLGVLRPSGEPTTDKETR